jgi:hypothetical protein
MPTVIFLDRWYPRAGLPNLSIAFGKGGRSQTKIFIPSVTIFDRRYKHLADDGRSIPSFAADLGT